MSSIGSAIGFGIQGLFLVSLIKDFFPAPDLAKTTVVLGAGDSRGDDGSGPGGDCPSVALYDVNGRHIGTADGASYMPDGNVATQKGIVPGGSQTLTILGSQTPEYMQVTAYGNDAVCLAWIMSTSANKDFRVWDGGIGFHCGLPWYESTALFPTADNNYRPPCIWMSADGRFIEGFSFRMTDFFFPTDGSVNASAMSEQWQNHSDTLCEAPGRLQFYKSTKAGNCIPFYPAADLPLPKNDDGTDADFDKIKNDYIAECGDPKPVVQYQPCHTRACMLGGDTGPNVPIEPVPALQVPGEPWNNVSLISHTWTYDKNGKKVPPPNMTAIAQMQGPGAVKAPSSDTPKPPIRLPPTQPKQDIHPVAPQPHSSGARQNRRTTGALKPKTAPEEMCHSELVISHHEEHTARRMCESPSSVGPDFISMVDSLYCDMCEKKLYPLCRSNTANGCFHLEKRKLMPKLRGRDGKRTQSPKPRSYGAVKEWK